MTTQHPDDFNPANFSHAECCLLIEAAFSQNQLLYFPAKKDGLPHFEDVSGKEVSDAYNSLRRAGHMYSDGPFVRVMPHVKTFFDQLEAELAADELH